MLAFPTEGSDACEFEHRGMVDAVSELLAAGRVKLYCVDTFDSETWSNPHIPLEERARRHQQYEAWILDEVIPRIRDDCGGASDLIACGCSLGAFHAANFALKCADVFPLADGWEARVPLHQIAPLVVHAIKFGGGYVNAASAAITRYT